MISISRWNSKYWTIPGGLGSAAAVSRWGWRGSRLGRRGSRTPAARSPRGPAAARGATAQSGTVSASHPADIYPMSRVTEASFNKYCDIKSQACNQRNVFLQSGPRTRTHHSWAAHLEKLIQFIQKFISLLIRGSITVELKQNTKDVHLKFSLGIFNT